MKSFLVVVRKEFYVHTQNDGEHCAGTCLHLWSSDDSLTGDCRCHLPLEGEMPVKLLKDSKDQPLRTEQCMKATGIDTPF
jgi:hypothetical protein